MTTKKKSPPPAKTDEVRRQDRPGHLDPAHAASLLAKGRAAHANDDDRGFVTGKKTKDGLAEELAEEAVVAMTSGEDDLEDDLNAANDEERGGPFVVTPAAQELAPGTDASNPRGAKREPFPRT